jgi:hypothetical protein
MALGRANGVAKPEGRIAGRRVNKQGLIYRPVTFYPFNPDPGGSFH